MGQSREEDILENILGGENPLSEPQSRNEQILMAILNKGEAPFSEAQSREEELLLQILESGGGGGGGLNAVEYSITSTTYTTS